MTDIVIAMFIKLKPRGLMVLGFFVRFVSAKISPKRLILLRFIRVLKALWFCEGGLKEICTKIIIYSFYVLLFVTPLTFTPLNSELFEFPKMHLTYFLTAVIIGTWLIKSVIVGKFIFKRTIFDIPLIFLLLSQIISTYFSIDSHTSIWGYYSRQHGGLSSTITYILLYWAYVSNMEPAHTRRAIRYLLLTATIVSIYGILEHFGFSPSCLLLKNEFGVNCWVQDVQARVFATLGQPNWMAAWLVAIIPLSWWKLVNSNKSQSPLLHTSYSILLSPYFILQLLIFAALLFTKSRSGLLGFTAAFIIFWLPQITSILHTPYSILRLKPLLHTPSSILPRLKPLFLTSFSTLLLITIFGTPWSPSVSDLLSHEQPATGQVQGTVLEQGGTESGEIRKIVWRGALDIWKENPLFGTGVETFAYSYYKYRPIEHNYTSEWNLLYNKAHNEYLNFLANTGLFGLLSYLVFIVCFISWSIKLNTHTSYFILHTSFLAGFTSIIVTNFFGFSTVTTATLFFLLPAMAQTLKQEVRSMGYGKLTPKKLLLGIPILLTSFYILLRISQFWYADVLYAKGEKLNSNENYSQAIIALNKAAVLRQEPIYFDELSYSAAALAAYYNETNNLDLSKQFAELAIDSSNYARSISPNNLNLIKSQAVLYYRLALVDPTYLSQAIAPLGKAVRLAPTDPKVHYNLGVLYSKLGENENAREILKKTVALKPDYKDARIALAVVYEALGDKQKAQEQYEYILQKIDPTDKEVQEKLDTLKVNNTETRLLKAKSGKIYL